MVIGLGLAQVAVNMATGKAGEQQVVPYDTALAVAAIALVATMLTAIRARGLLKLVPILVGVAVGYVAAFFFGIVDFTKVHEAAWLAVPQFGSPEFNLAAILFMIPVAIAPIVEHVGGILAVGSVVGKDYTQSPGLHRTLLGDGLAVNVVGLFGGPPVTTYGEVTGAVMLTRNYNPVIMTWAAGFAILMAFVGKFGALLQTIPMPVMGGIMVLLFGSIAGIGLKTLMDARTDLMNPRNLCIVSVTLVTGIGGLSVTIGSFSLQGISLCGVLAVLLNLILPPGAGRHRSGHLNPYNRPAIRTRKAMGHPSKPAVPTSCRPFQPLRLVLLGLGLGWGLAAQAAPPALPATYIGGKCPAPIVSAWIGSWTWRRTTASS